MTIVVVFVRKCVAVLALNLDGPWLCGMSATTTTAAGHGQGAPQRLAVELRSEHETRANLHRKASQLSVREENDDDDKGAGAGRRSRPQEPVVGCSAR